jgi:hypothetical protein
MNDFIKGFVKGAKETPREYFSPAVALWRGLVRIMKLFFASEKNEKDDTKHT